MAAQISQLCSLLCLLTHEVKSQESGIFSAASGGCSVQHLDSGSLEITCYGTTEFPLLNTTSQRELVTNLHIQRSSLRLPVLSDIYPNLSEATLDNCDVTNGISGETFGALKSVRKLTFYWTPLSLEDFSNILCSLSTAGENLEVYFKGIFPVGNPVNLTASALECLKSSKINHFEFSSNCIHPRSVKTLFCSIGPGLKWIRVGKLLPGAQPVVFDDEFFKCLENVTTLEHLQLSSTWVEGISSDTMRSLDLYHAAIRFNIESVSDLDQLEELYLGQNAYRYFREFTDSKVSLKKLQLLNLEQNSFPMLYPFGGHLFPSLRTLVLSKNHPTIQIFPGHFIAKLEKLTDLLLDSARIGHISEKAFFSNSLELLNLDKITLDLKRVPMKLFSFATSLRHLSLNHLNLNFPAPGHYQDLINFCHYAFQNLGELEVLSLRYAGFVTVYEDMFLNTNRIKMLDVSNNQLDNIRTHSMSNLQSLELLKLDSNSLSSLNSSMLPNASHVFRISISINPLVCDCYLYEFRQWLNNASTYQLDPAQSPTYACTFGKGGITQRVTEYNPTYRECFTYDLPVLYQIISYGTAVLMLALLTISVCTRFRWHLYYCYIRARARGKQYQQLADPRKYKYDAFVSYNRDDTSWVVRTLRPALEDQHKLKLCLHDRDWMGGADIIDNIIDSIDSSRKVVLVITNSFAASNWCQLELTMAQHRLFAEDRNNLVLVVKEEVVNELMTPRLALEMRERTYIKWEEGGMGEKVFWRRLVEAIEGPVASVKQTVL